MSHRVRKYEGSLIPSATSTKVELCGEPDCGHVHMIGFDNEGKPLCELVISYQLFVLQLDAFMEMQSEKRGRRYDS